MISNSRLRTALKVYSSIFAALLSLSACSGDSESPSELTYEPSPKAKLVTNEPLGSMVTYEPEAHSDD